ncbi:MAG: DMT family transporter [Chloroflexi bacterium]|nr:DMT family transporter [Chloroflexota bacterium]
MSGLLQILPVLLIGLLGGVAVGFQGPISGVMSARMGPVASSVIMHLSGFLASVVLLLALGGQELREWRTIPRPYFAAGALGLVLFISLSVTLPRIGAANATALLIGGQLVLALVIDQNGWFGMTPQPITASRVIGVALLFAAGYFLSK